MQIRITRAVSIDSSARSAPSRYRTAAETTKDLLTSHITLSKRSACRGSLPLSSLSLCCSLSISLTCARARVHDLHSNRVLAHTDFTVSRCLHFNFSRELRYAVGTIIARGSSILMRFNEINFVSQLEKLNN